MLIGVPKEIKNHEYRVGLTPAGARELSARGHQVLIERGFYYGPSDASTPSVYVRRNFRIGIAADDLSQLFQPFKQLDSSDTRRYGGTGLGLSIAQRLVQLMGGDMGATSVHGQGSLFWFDIPLYPTAVLPSPSSQA